MRTMRLGSGAALAAGLLLSSPAFAADGEPHFRWGVGGGMGYIVPVGIVDFHGELRLGAQLNERMGLYGEVGTMFGFGLGGRATGDEVAVRAAALGLYHFGPLFEYDLDGPFLAGGPILARGGWAHVAQSADVDGNVSQTALAAGGWMPGLDLRAGFVAGKKQSDGKRKGFSMSLDMKFLYARLTSVEQEAGVGGVSQDFTVGKGVLGVTPTLQFGFDSK